MHGCWGSRRGWLRYRGQVSGKLYDRLKQPLFDGIDRVGICTFVDMYVWAQGVLVWKERRREATGILAKHSAGEPVWRAGGCGARLCHNVRNGEISATHM